MVTGRVEYGSVFWPLAGIHAEKDDDKGICYFWTVGENARFSHVDSKCV